MIEAMIAYYDHNPDFKDYVNKYCVKHGIPFNDDEVPQDVMSHYLIQDVYNYYLEIELSKVKKKEVAE